MKDEGDRTDQKYDGPLDFTGLTCPIAASARVRALSFLFARAPSPHLFLAMTGCFDCRGPKNGKRKGKCASASPPKVHEGTQEGRGT